MGLGNQQEQALKGLWIESTGRLRRISGSESKELISSLEAHDAFLRARVLNGTEFAFRICVEDIVDAEGSLEILRLCRHHEYDAHVFLPLDLSVISQATRLGCTSIGIQVSVPKIEIGVMRPDLLSSILPQIPVPVWAFGSIRPTDIDFIRNLGFDGVLIQEAIVPEEPEIFEQLWSTRNDIKEQ
jgi:hypothetical protein